ncbi:MULTISPECIES: phage tail protein [unclassified Paenibacillus]|uniref:phage tail protein n=1 Tax=unclassified Paenibacillus TaxID=185978 RepID=UPI0030F98049
MAEFYSILTTVGQNKIATAAAGGPLVNLTQMAVGDGGGAYYDPSPSQTTLRAEKWRGNVSDVSIDSTHNNWVVVDTTIPTEIGGFTIREAGIIDADGDLIAIGKYPATYKPAPSEGSAKDLYLRMILAVSNTSAVTFTIDPSVSLVTRQEFNSHVAEYDEFTDRFNTAEVDSVALQPGLTVVNSPKDARFRLGEMRGRTLINLLGNAGSCDSIVGWTGFNSPLLSVDSSTYEDVPSSIKVQQRGSGDTGVSSPYFNVDSSGYYVAVAFLRFPATGFTELTMYFEGSGAAGKLSSTTLNSIQRLTWMPVTVLLSPTQLGAVTRVRIRFEAKGGTSEDAFNVDGVRVYQITDEKYNELSGKPHAEISDEFPMCSSGIHGVDGPYAISTFDNLIPPLYEYERITNPSSEWSFNSDYEAVQKTTSTEGHYIKFQIDVEPDMEYTLSCEHNGYMAVTTRDGTTQIVPWTNSQEVTINPNDSIIYIFFGNYNGSTGVAGAYTFKNPMLTIGAEPKPFEPQRKSVLAFQTELHANPTDGSDPDILFEQNGQYFKLAKWKKVVLDGSLNYTVYGSKDGFRTISTPVPGAVYPSTVTDTIGEMTKYDGKLLTKNDAFNINDSWYLNGAIKSAILSIPSADSGWGDDYEPTQDEVKAYFNGYKMFTVGQGHTSTYNGTGVKAWVAIVDISAPEGPADTQILPTGTYSQWTPCQLLYRLAKESVEPIVSEGSLLLTEGDNMVEVGTGIVLRERANPVQSGVAFVINDINYSSSRLTNMVDRFISVYRNSRKDSTWELRTNNAYGNERRVTFSYDPLTTYSATYIKLDKSPIQPIIGTLAANEKAQISDLTAGVAEALQRVSVVEQKKEEKDVPGWIGATLLNGATGSVKYRKIGLTLYVGGTLFTGAKIAGTVLFRLPDDYTPKTVTTLVLATYDSGAELRSVVVDFYPDGSVRLASDARSVIIFNSVSVSLDWR